METYSVMPQVSHAPLTEADDALACMADAIGMAAQLGRYDRVI